MTIEEELQQKFRELVRIYDLRLVSWVIDHSLHHPLQPLNLTIKISGIPREPPLREANFGDTSREVSSTRLLDSPSIRTET